MRGLFISGTDTGVGKTITSAIFLLRASQIFHQVVYHKPIQTGIESDCDVREVSRLVTESDHITSTRGLSLTRPLSPHLAAHYQNTYLDFASVLHQTRAACTGDFNIVEGAGGLLVPINNRYLMIDLVSALRLPCVIVARSSLGTINHTLLSLEALRAKQIPLLGVVMVGPKNRDNEASIKFYGRITNLLALPLLPKLDRASIAQRVTEQQEAIDRFLINSLSSPRRRGSKRSAIDLDSRLRGNDNLI